MFVCLFRDDNGTWGKTDAWMHVIVDDNSSRSAIRPTRQCRICNMDEMVAVAVAVTKGFLMVVLYFRERRLGIS